MRLVELRETRIAMEASRAAEREVAERLWRGRLWRLFLAWCGWYLLGAALAFSSLGIRDAVWGDVLLWSGLAVGNVGAWVHAMFFAIAATERGDL